MAVRVGHRKDDGVKSLPLAAPVPRDKFVKIRCTVGEHDAWRRAASLEGRTMSEMIRDAVNSYARLAIKVRGRTRPQAKL